MDGNVTGLDVSALTQVVFSVATAWYLLTTFSRKIEKLSELIKESQKEALDSTKETKEMFAEIRELIKETCVLVQKTSESVHIQSQLTEKALERLEKFAYMGAPHTFVDERG